MSRHLFGPRAALGLTTAVVVAASAITSPSLASGSSGPGVPGGAPWAVVATGLDNPRQLTIDLGHGDGRLHRGGHGREAALYVAEAGRGGTGTCVQGPEGEACFGLSAAVTRVRGGQQDRVVTGLPSLAARDGSRASGAADVVVKGSWYAVTLGLGADPALRDTIEGGEGFGTLVAGRFGGGQFTLADLAEFEAANDPDGAGPDSNPTGLSATHRGFVVTDSGANALQFVDWRGHITTLATFPERVVPSAPPAPPGDLPMQSVPTSAVRGPDGAWYVSELTGFPFPAGGARIYRVFPGMPATVYASGLTNVTDLAWHEDTLYAVQLAGNAGLMAAQGLPIGSLERINDDGSHTTVAGDCPRRTAWRWPAATPT